MVASPQSLESLLQRQAMEPVAPALRDAIRQLAWPGEEVSAADSPAVLADTLDLLAGLSADGEVLAAALLPGLSSMQAQVLEPLRSKYPGVVVLVEGQAAAAQVWALHAEQADTRNSEGLRRLLLAIVRDLRAVPILLARQLARMRAAERLPEQERKALAQLTRDIHAPLANRLGIWQLKWELEDLAFRYLEPETYQGIARQLDEKRTGRERYIESVKAALGHALSEHGIAAEISGRPKHIYSIWRKMQRKQVPMEELYDLRAVRVAVGDVAACYAALGVVHALWAPIPSEFDDYIARPKANDYRSLHTAVVGPEGRALEVQIRTHEMHAQAELGVAAHWKYKEGKGGSDAFDRKIAWMRRLLEQAGETGGGLSEGLGDELAEERIYTLTPKGEVIDLPSGATPLDFAYHVHTMVGHRCRGAKVNGRIVPLGYKLHSGDRVEVLTAKEADPRRDWLLPSSGYLASGRARDKVRAWFHKLDHARNVQAGREMLDRELKRLGLQQADLSLVFKRFHVPGLDDLYIQVAMGDLGCNQVGRALHEEQRALAQPVAPALPMRPPRRPKAAAQAGFTVEGVGNLLVQLARCCQPVAGEPIAGYLTRARGVTVHRHDCAAFLRLSAAHPQRVLPVEWGHGGKGYEVDVKIEGMDRKWLLKDITTLIAQEEAHVLDIHSDFHDRGGKVHLRLRLRVDDFGQLSTLLGKLDALPGVHGARRSG